MSQTVSAFEQQKERELARLKEIQASLKSVEETIKQEGFAKAIEPPRIEAVKLDPIERLELILIQKPFYIYGRPIDGQIKRDESDKYQIYVYSLPTLLEDSFIRDTIEYLYRTKGRIDNRRVIFIIPDSAKTPTAFCLEFNDPNLHARNKIYEEMLKLIKEKREEITKEVIHTANALNVKLKANGNKEGLWKEAVEETERAQIEKAETLVIDKMIENKKLWPFYQALYQSEVVVWFMGPKPEPEAQVFETFTRAWSRISKKTANGRAVKFKTSPPTPPLPNIDPLQNLAVRIASLLVHGDETKEDAFKYRYDQLLTSLRATQFSIIENKLKVIRARQRIKQKQPFDVSVVSDINWHKEKTSFKFQYEFLNACTTFDSFAKWLGPSFAMARYKLHKLAIKKAQKMMVDLNPTIEKLGHEANRLLEVLPTFNDWTVIDNIAPNFYIEFIFGNLNSWPRLFKKVVNDIRELARKDFFAIIAEWRKKRILLKVLLKSGVSLQSAVALKSPVSLTADDHDAILMESSLIELLKFKIIKKLRQQNHGVVLKGDNDINGLKRLLYLDQTIVALYEKEPVDNIGKNYLHRIPMRFMIDFLSKTKEERSGWLFRQRSMLFLEFTDWQVQLKERIQKSEPQYWVKPWVPTAMRTMRTMRSMGAVGCGVALYFTGSFYVIGGVLIGGELVHQLQNLYQYFNQPQMDLRKAEIVYDPLVSSMETVKSFLPCFSRKEAKGKPIHPSPAPIGAPSPLKGRGQGEGD